MPHRDDEARLEADDSASTAVGNNAPETGDGTASEGNAYDDREREIQRPQNPPGEGSLGMRVIAGETPKHNTSGEDLLPVDVVAVHGLHGDRDSTWTTDDTPGGNWLKDHMDEWNSGSRILSFGYDGSSPSVLTMAGIREEAVRLLDDLVELRKDVSRPIAFVAHDIGGTIVKEALRIASFECMKYRSVKNWTSLLVFFACPHRCTSIRDMEDKVANLLFAKDTLRPVGAVRMIRELGRSIIEINGSFAASCIVTLPGIINVYSEVETAALQIFGKYMTTLDIAFERRIGCPKAHGVMSKSAPDGLFDHIHRALTLYDSRRMLDDTSANFLRTFGRLSAPIYPLESSYGPEHRFDWIRQHEVYSEWLDGHGPSTLHVHGVIGASDASEYIFQHLDAYRVARQDHKTLAYFAFDRFDDRCNSVMAMLHTLLTQMVHQDQSFCSAIPSLCEEMSFHHSWTQADLFRLFRVGLAQFSDGDVFCVINGLDMCDDSQAAFLRDLCGFMGVTEHRCKIAVTSTTNSELLAVLADWPTINLDNRPEDSDTANANLQFEIALDVQELTQEYPVFTDFKETITRKLVQCGQDKHWRRLVLSQLRRSKSSTTNSATQRGLDLLPSTTLKYMFERILTGVPSERQAWARKALGWTLYAFRPLSVWELGVALALDVDHLTGETMDLDGLVYRHVVVDLDEVFGGIFIIKHNEVHFGHPDARDFFMSADGQQEHVWYDVTETAHQEISDVCHRYLSLRQVQEWIAMSHDSPPTNSLGCETVIPRYSLHEYAIQYWPRHYKLIPETSRPTERVLGFVRNTNAMRCWAEAYWWLSNPVSRTDRSFLSPLPIFAGLGLQDLVTRWLDLHSDVPRADQDRALALAEAARNAHADVVRKLLAHSRHNQASLRDVLLAAVSCCDEAVLGELVAYVLNRFESFDWPPIILCRAAQFGLENIVRRLLESGASMDTAITFQGMTPLHLAARGGHIRVVKVLLEHKASLTACSIFDRVPLLLAALYGEATIVKLLLDAGAEVNVADSQSSAVSHACRGGYHKTVEIFIGAGCDMGCDSRGVWSPLTITAYHGFIKSTRLLLDKKASTEVEGPGHLTPLRCAAWAGHVELCKLLITNGAAVDATDPDGWTALHWASSNGYTSVATYLLDQGADINRTTRLGETSILFAASRNFTGLVQLLLERGADLHVAAETGWTPVHISCQQAQMTRILMENGADANQLMGVYTPLHWAVVNNQAEVVKVLLSFNPNLEIPFSTAESRAWGGTALTAATARGNTDIVRLLLEAGANVNQKSNENYFPLEYAVIRNKEDVLRILMEYRPELDLVDDDGDTALHCINSLTSSTIAKLLINAGANLEIRNKAKYTPLCKAVLVRNIDIVSYLIVKKAELNIVGGKCGGPLHLACRICDLELVKTLVHAGADVNLVDPSAAGTPIQSACCSPYYRPKLEMQENIIRYLIHEAKADVTTIGGLQKCALNSASGWSTPEMVKLILEKGAKPDVQDEMGRGAVHFAACQSLGHLQPIIAAGADIEMRDAMGRTALHWAILSGQVDVIEYVLSHSSISVDQADSDGWTPLLWAARGCGTAHRPAIPNAQYEVIKFLLDRGANPCVSGDGLDRKWSPVGIAQYHGVDDTVVQLLMEKAKAKLAEDGGEHTEDESSHKSEKASDQNANCDSCLCSVFGIRYNCETCLDFDFCSKCYLSRQHTHSHHTFMPIGPEYPDKHGSDKHEIDDGSDTHEIDDGSDDSEEKESRDSDDDSEVNESRGSDDDSDSSDTDQS